MDREDVKLISIRLPKSIHEFVREQAVAEGCTIVEFVRRRLLNPVSLAEQVCSLEERVDLLENELREERSRKNVKYMTLRKRLDGLHMKYKTLLERLDVLQLTVDMGDVCCPSAMTGLCEDSKGDWKEHKE